MKAAEPEKKTWLRGFRYFRIFPFSGDVRINPSNYTYSLIIVPSKKTPENKGFTAGHFIK